MSDTEFMAIKAFGGKFVSVTGTINAVTNTIEYVPASGKTFYFHSAKITMNTNPSGTLNTSGATTINDQTTAELKIDGTTKDTAKIGGIIQTDISQPLDAGGGGGIGFQAVAHFDCKGMSLEGNGSKKVEIENVDDDGSCTATLTGWIEDTGSSPQV